MFLTYWGLRNGVVELNPLVLELHVWGFLPVETFIMFSLSTLIYMIGIRLGFPENSCLVGGIFASCLPFIVVVHNLAIMGVL